MNTIKRLRIILIGAAALALALLLTQGQEDSALKEYPFETPKAMKKTVPAALQDVVDGQDGEASDEASGGTSENVITTMPSGDQQKEQVGEGEENPEEEELAAEFDPEEARAEAEAEVRQYETELAATLWTHNPNARKMRIKAADLKARADDIDSWIETQDARTDWSPEEKKAWEAKRDVWVNHAAEMRQVSQKLSQSRGTRRKVRNIAREMKDRLEDRED